MTKQDKYKCIKRKLIAKNSRFNIYFDTLLLDKIKIKDYLIVSPKVKKNNNIVGICIIPKVKNKFGLMKSWRHQLNKFVWQAPAGFAERNESIKATAQKELLEETGLYCSKNNIKSLGSFIPDSGLLDGKVAMFVAKNLKRRAHQIDKEVGVNKLKFLTKHQINKKIKSNEINTGATLITLMKCFRYE